MIIPLANSGKGLAATPAWLEVLHLSALVSTTQTDNFSRTAHAPSRKNADTYELGLTSLHSRQLGRNVLLLGAIEAGTIAVPDYELTAYSRLGGRLTLQRKFGLGPQATVLQVGAGTNYKAARYADDRGWTTEASIQLAKRVLPNVKLAATVGWLEHTAQRDVFDLNQHSYSAEARWDLNNRWSLLGSAGRISGDIVANAPWSIWGLALGGTFGPAASRYYNSRPWKTTNLYGPGWASYNMEGDVDLWSVALECAVGDHTAVELRRSVADVVNVLGVAYPTDSWSLGLTHRF